MASVAELKKAFFDGIDKVERSARRGMHLWTIATSNHEQLYDYFNVGCSLSAANASLVARLQTLSKAKGISSAEAEALMLADSGITKIGEPEDVANLVAYIVSPQNRYLHGALIDMDGGTTKTM